MHADTLMMVTYAIDTDSMFREMRAYHKVRMYRTDVQGHLRLACLQLQRLLHDHVS